MAFGVKMQVENGETPTYLTLDLTVQKRAVSIITFSPFDAHSFPLFKKLKILNIADLSFPHTALFMHQYHSN